MTTNIVHKEIQAMTNRWKYYITYKVKIETDNVFFTQCGKLVGGENNHILEENFILSLKELTLNRRFNIKYSTKHQQLAGTIIRSLDRQEFIFFDKIKKGLFHYFEDTVWSFSDMKKIMKTNKERLPL